MPLYRVITSQIFHVTYLVEAGSTEEAQMLAETGDAEETDNTFSSILKDETTVTLMEG